MPGLKRTRSASGYELHRTKRVSKPTRTAIRSVVKAALHSASEQKFAQVDSGASEFNINSLAAPQYVDFPNIPQGTQSNQRTGNRITTRGLECRFTLHNNGTGNNSMGVRVMLVEVRGGGFQSDANITNDLFEPTNNGGSDTTYAGDLRDLCFKTNRENMRVLKEEVIILSGANSSSVGNGTAAETFRHWYIPHKRAITYADTAGTSQTNVRYSLVLLGRGMENDAANTDVECVAATGIYFTDV